MVKTTHCVERGHLELPEYSVSFFSRYLLPPGTKEEDSGSYFNGNFVVIDSKTRKKSDTVRLESDDLSNCPLCRVFLWNYADNLQQPPLLVQVVTPGEDIYYHNSFVGYRDGRLQELFEFEDTLEQGTRLRPINDSVLYGMTTGRDDVVDAYESNYPVSIDLKTFRLTRPAVDNQYIGFSTVALEDFHAFPVVDGRLDSSVSALVKVKAGDELIVDTFYRSRKKVTLLLADSVRVEIKLQTAQKKIRHLLVG